MSCDRARPHGRQQDRYHGRWSSHHGVTPSEVRSADQMSRNGNAGTAVDGFRQHRPEDDIGKALRRLYWRFIVVLPAGHLGSALLGACLVFAGFSILTVSLVILSSKPNNDFHAASLGRPRLQVSSSLPSLYSHSSWSTKIEFQSLRS